MSDSLADYEMPPSIAHRCVPPRKAKVGDRFTCSCGMHYAYAPGPFAGWQPTTPPELPDPPIKRHVTRGGLRGKGSVSAQTDRAS